jgi:hypothetical protein
LANIKIPAKDCPPLVFPHPLYKEEKIDGFGKNVVLFEEWKVNYNVNEKVIDF